MTNSNKLNKNLAFIFPGQGSQSLKMLADIAAEFTEVKDTFAIASNVLGYDLWQLTQQGPAEELDKTIHTQPALLTASYAIWRIIQANTAIKPTYLAGHSLGEYTALVCANALDFADAVKLVAARGQYMQEAVPSGIGAMGAIIGLDDAAVTTICEEAIQSSQSADEILAPANFNSIGQVVIAGHRVAVECALELAKEKGAKMAVFIPVSVPSHCLLMAPAAARLAALLAATPIQSPTIPVINNIHAVAYTTADAIRDGLAQQLTQPVQWVASIQAFIKTGVTTIIECGPGKILTGLNKRIDKNLHLLTTSDLPGLRAVLAWGAENSHVA